MCADHLALTARFGKPLICAETCCDSLDDRERGALARDGIETLERRGIGWRLCEGAFVTGRRGKTGSNAVRPNEGYMPFVLAGRAHASSHA